MDIDECAIPDLNTCGGGMNPHGVDADMALDKSSEFAMYIGEPNGLSQVFVWWDWIYNFDFQLYRQFNLKSKQALTQGFSLVLETVLLVIALHLKSTK